MIRLFTLTLVIAFGQVLHAQEYLKTKDATIVFVSSAPLEEISATSNHCRGVLNTENGEFAFQVLTSSFLGFNSALQKEHFCENYMEITDHPNAEFRGRLLGELNFHETDSLTIKAKGKLQIHGVSDERIIDLVLVKTDDGVAIESEFVVELGSHGIEIPRIVYHKIAEEIHVRVQGVMK